MKYYWRYSAKWLSTMGSFTKLIFYRSPIACNSFVALGWTRISRLEAELAFGPPGLDHNTAQVLDEPVDIYPLSLCSAWYPALGWPLEWADL